MINIFSFQGHRQCLLQGSFVSAAAAGAQLWWREAKDGPCANKTLFTGTVSSSDLACGLQLGSPALTAFTSNKPQLYLGGRGGGWGVELCVTEHRLLFLKDGLASQCAVPVWPCKSVLFTFSSLRHVNTSVCCLPPQGWVSPFPS